MRGPKPVPTAIRELGGRVHSKKVDHVDLGELADEDLTPDIFEGLPDPVLKRAQNTLSLLRRRNVLNGADTESFARYCQHLRNAYAAQKIINKEGVLLADANGNLKKHPAVQVHRDNSLAALRYEEQFGLTPSARMRLTTAEQLVVDREVAEFEDFLADK